MSRIFISYSRTDKKIADRLVALLRGVYGHDEVWFDEEIHGGDDWWTAILQNIGECEQFIFLASGHSLHSPYCQAEFQEALRLQKRYVPVLIRKTPYPGPFPESLKRQLSSIQYVDLTRGFGTANAIAPVYAAVNMQLDHVPDEPLPPLDPEPTPKPSIEDVPPPRPRPLIALVGLLAALIMAVGVVWMVSREDDAAQWPLTEMIAIPAGPFMMGSDDPALASPDAQPAHTVEMDAYWIDRYEVTNAQYAYFVDEGYAASPWETEQYPDGQDDYPVTRVRWDDANVYCKTVGKRLPTEAEWEKAARGTEGLIWPWGDEWDKAKANTSESGLMAAQSVGSYPAGDSPYGVGDMVGNVAEWTGDWYHADYYASSPPRDPAGPPFGDTRVVRGGSWRETMAFTYTFYRQGIFPPFVQDATIGFRCASDSNVD